jgi:hypothetical protein
MAEDSNAAATAYEVKAPAESAAEELKAAAPVEETNPETAADSKAAAHVAEVKAAVTADGAVEDSKAAQEFAEVKAEASSSSAPTLRQIFELPEKDTDPADDRWQAFQEKVSKEVKGIKWTATIPDLAPKVCELLDIKIPDVLTAAWKKVADIQAVMEKSKKTPDETIYLELAQHTINSEHKPSIDVKIKGATVKKIALVIQLGFNLKGFLLKIQNGAITELQTGQCEAKGTIKYGGLTIAEKKLEPIKLPFSILIPGDLFIPIPEAEDEEVPIPEPDKEKAEELERIEL